MRWIALPGSNALGDLSSSSRVFRSVCDPSTSLEKVETLRAQFSGDFSLAWLRVTAGARCIWVQNSRAWIPSSPVCAVNPRSRKEWLLLHNLPDTLLGKELNEKEATWDDAVSDIRRQRDKGIDHAEKRTGGSGNPRTETLLERNDSSLEGVVEAGETLESSHARNVRGAWRSGGSVDRSQVLRKRVEDLENGKFREIKERKNETDARETAQRGGRIESHADTSTGVEIRRSGGSVERYQPHCPQISNGRDEESETGQTLESKLEKKSNSGAPTERAGRFDTSSEERHAVKGPVEMYRAPQPGTDENEATGVINPDVTPKRGHALESSEEARTGRDVWTKDSFGVRFQHPLQSSISQARLTTKESNEGSFEPSEETSSVREARSDWDVVDGFKQRGPAFLYRNKGGSENSNLGENKESNSSVQSDVEVTTGRGKRVVASSQEIVEGLTASGPASLHGNGGNPETGSAGKGSRKEEMVGYDKEKVVEVCKNPAAESNAWVPSVRREAVDYNGEKVIEVWRKGRVVKRYKPLGMEFLYGRKKPTRLYGPLNSRGEVPGSDLAPVPRRYRDRCENQQGWSIKEMVTKILELNHWEDVDFILNQWVGRYNRKNFPALMLLMTSTGALKHSARVFTWMKSQRCYRARNDIYNLVIWLYARHNRVDRARALFKEMQEWRCKPDLETYNALINVHGRVKQWRESLLFFDRMLRAAVPPSTGTYNNLINACGSSGQWKKAFELYGRMKVDGIEMDIVTHNTILTALKIGGQYEKAIEHFERILEWEVLPDCVSLNIIISCFSKMERYDEAVQLFNSMKSNKWDGCMPNLVTFTTVMHVYAACGQVKNVRAVFDMMVEEGIVPNIVSYNTLIGAYASFGMDVEAHEIFETMQKVGFEPDIVSYTALMNAYSKTGKPDDAARVFELIKRCSRKPNIVTYNTLIDAYSSVGRVTEALRLLPDMDFDEIPPTVVTICSLIVACGRSGQIERIRDVLRIAALRNIGLNVNVYNTVMSIYLNGGMYEAANEFYTSMKENGVIPDAITFAILINGAAKVGNISQAQRHFNEMLTLGICISVEACSALIHAYAEQGLPEDAHAVLTTMKESGCAPNVMTYTGLIHAYRIADMPESAVAVFEEMEILGIQLDVVACSALFTVFNRCGQAQKTLLLWSKWRDRIQFGTAAYRELSKACSLIGNWKTAMELLEEMQQVGVKPNSTIGNNMLRSLTKGGKVQTLTKMFKQLQELGMMATKDTYNILIDGYSRIHNWKECLEILDRFKADNLQPDLDAYTMVLKCLEKVQLWDKYLEVYNGIMSSGYLQDLEVSKVVVKALRETGQNEKALQLEFNLQATRQENESILSAAVSVLTTYGNIESSKSSL